MDIPQTSISNISLKIAYLKFFVKFPRGHRVEDLDAYSCYKEIQLYLVSTEKPPMIGNINWTS